jgi:hypothetical protein
MTPLGCNNYSIRKKIGGSADCCYLGPYQAFKQKTSPLDTPFSRKASSKLLTFQWIFKKRFKKKRLASLRFNQKLNYP